MIEVRPCRAEDFDAVIGLLQQLWPSKQLNTAALRSIFDKGLASGAPSFFVATDGSKCVGFGSLSIKSSLRQEGLLGNIDELVIDAEYRGRGVGTQLVNHLLAVARERGCGCVELECGHQRKDAHKFYESRSFENRALLFSRVP